LWGHQACICPTEIKSTEIKSSYTFHMVPEHH